jgi:uncharacterized protein YdaU (DUF1376 family)
VNYYPFHLGDYAAHTAHLEPMEDLAYRRMLDLYYLREDALPEDPAEIARLIRLKGCVDEVRTVLREFFTNNDGDGWIHMRCEEEIRKMQDKQAKARASAEASVNARKARASLPLNECSTVAERPLNEGSATNTNTNTNTKDKEARKRATIFEPGAIDLPHWLDRVLWCRWCEDRKARKKPVSKEGAKAQIAKLDGYRLEGYTPQSVIEHCIAGGYQGLFPPPAGKTVQAQPTAHRDYEETQRMLAARDAIPVGQVPPELREKIARIGRVA